MTMTRPARLCSCRYSRNYEDSIRDAQCPFEKLPGVKQGLETNTSTMKLNLSLSRPIAQEGLRWSISGDILIVAFRWLVVGCQAATLLITWPLWQVHASPPMLPALPLPAFDLGPLLLLSLVL